MKIRKSVIFMVLGIALLVTAITFIKQGENALRSDKNIISIVDSELRNSNNEIEKVSVGGVGRRDVPVFIKVKGTNAKSVEITINSSEVTKQLDKGTEVTYEKNILIARIIMTVCILSMFTALYFAYKEKYN